jgi:hypothetical protein
MYYFCTYFDANYLSRGLAMYRSLVASGQPFRLYVLCLDDESERAVRMLPSPDIVPISLSALEADDRGLYSVKSSRSLVEYYFTVTPTLPLYLFNHFPEIDLITYLDSDLFFFTSPAPLYAEIGDRSIAIIEHRFPPRLVTRFARKGRFNVSWVSFRRDTQGLECLRSWREQCLQWCYDRVETDRYADQKYLDTWPERFPATAIVAHKGANLAPWNVDGYTVSLRDGVPYVDDEPLIFFHFHGFKQTHGSRYATGFSYYRSGMTQVIRDHIFLPYYRVLKKVGDEMASLKIIRGATSIRAQDASRPLLVRTLHALEEYFRFLYRELFIPGSHLRFDDPEQYLQK